MNGDSSWWVCNALFMQYLMSSRHASCGLLLPAGNGKKYYFLVWCLTFLLGDGENLLSADVSEISYSWKWLLGIVFWCLCDSQKLFDAPLVVSHMFLVKLTTQLEVGQNFPLTGVTRTLGVFAVLHTQGMIRFLRFSAIYAAPETRIILFFPWGAECSSFRSQVCCGGRGTICALP